jgi:hypothetical protein
MEFLRVLAIFAVVIMLVYSFIMMISPRTSWIIFESLKYKYAEETDPADTGSYFIYRAVAFFGVIYWVLFLLYLLSL